MVLSSLKNISGSHREVRLDSCSLTHYSLTLSYSSVCSSACSRLHPVMIPGSLQREFLAAGRFTLVYFHFIAQNQGDGFCELCKFGRYSG
uniref:Uncharacterized protein n=1 Tax=Rhizophagus irregularis (strain DAOM 181602 / DAOM 197198 / MUCL 43194) TaxID=747089 RepID=U9TT21_RHIID